MAAHDILPQFKGFNYVHLNAPSTTVVKAAPGLVQAVVMTGPNADDTITLYDGLDTSGAVMAVISSTVATTCTLTFGVPFRTGLTAVTSGTADVVITYL